MANNDMTIKMPSAPEQAPVDTASTPDQITDPTVRPGNVGMATGPAPIPNAPTAVQPNPAAQTDSNAPQTDTPAGASIPKPLQNDPSVASQKMATQADNNKKSDAPWHRWIRQAATELSGGPIYRYDVDADGKATRTEVQPSLAHIGMALAAEVIKGGMAGGNQPNGAAAFGAGAQVADQERQKVKQAQADQEARAKGDQEYKMKITEANMRMHQNAMLAGAASEKVANSITEPTDFFTKGVLDGSIPMGDMTHDEMEETDAAAALANGKSNVTKDYHIAFGPAKPALDASGNQLVINGQPAWKHQYMVIHGAANGKMPLTKDMQAKFEKYGLMPPIPEGGIGQPEWPFAKIAKNLSDLASISAGEEMLTEHKDDITRLLDHAGTGGPDGKGKETLDGLDKQIKNDPDFRNALGMFAQAQAHTPGANHHIEDILNTMGTQGPQGQHYQGLIMNHLGLSSQDLDDMHNARTEAETDAKTKLPQEKALTPEEKAEKDAHVKEMLSVALKNDTDAKKLLTDASNHDAIVDAMGTGHVAAANLAFMLRSKEGQALITDVTKKYPDFDSSKAAAYPKMYDDYTSQKPKTAGFAINSGGTAFQHLSEMLALNTNKSHIPGTSDYTAYKNKMDTVVSELGQFYGNTTIPGLQDFKDTLASTLPGNREAAIRTQAKSMSDKMNSYENGWITGAPSAMYQAPMPGLSHDALVARAKLDPSFKSRPPLGAAGQESFGGKPYWVNAQHKKLQEVVQ